MFLLYYHIPHFNFICGLPKIYYATCFPLSFRRSNNIGIADYAGNREDRTSNQHAVIIFGHKLVISMAFKSFFSCETVPVTMLLTTQVSLFHLQDLAFSTLLQKVYREEQQEGKGEEDEDEEVQQVVELLPDRKTDSREAELASASSIFAADRLTWLNNIIRQQLLWTQPTTITICTTAI